MRTVTKIPQAHCNSLYRQALLDQNHSISRGERATPGHSSVRKNHTLHIFNRIAKKDLFSTIVSGDAEP